MLTLIVGVLFGPCSVMQYCDLSSFFFNHLAEKERAGYFENCIPHDCKYSVAPLHGTMGRSAVCACGISWSYTFTSVIRLFCWFLLR